MCRVWLCLDRQTGQQCSLFLHTVLSGFISREEGEGMLALWVGGQVFISSPALCRVSDLRGLQSFLDLHAVPLWLQFKIMAWEG